MKFFLSILLFFSLSLSFSQDEEGAHQLVREGIQLHDRGDYNGALTKYKKALTLDENNYNAMIETAITYSTMGKNQEAVDQCWKILEIHGDSEEDLMLVYVTLGNSLDAMGKGESAVEVYEEGIAKYPDKYLLRFNLGITHMRLKEDDKAQKRFTESAYLNPEHPGTHNALARLNFENNRIAAILAFCRFFVLENISARAKENYGYLDYLMYKGVERVNKNTITINLDGGMLLDSTAEIPENHFGKVELSLVFAQALDVGDKKMKAYERFNNSLMSICGSLEENLEGNRGFFWEYYAPYFIELNKKGHTLAYTLVIFSASDEKSIKKVQQKNSYLISDFFKWHDKYEWPELPK